MGGCAGMRWKAATCRIVLRHDPCPNAPDGSAPLLCMNPLPAMTMPTTQLTVAHLAQRLASLVPTQFLRQPEAAILDVARRWSERQRHWHGPAHLLTLLDAFQDVAREDERDALRLAAAYHDAIYSPLRSDNEAASARLLLEHAADIAHPVVR